MLKTIFAEGGWLSEKLNGYVHRPGQLGLAEAVDSALEEGHHLLAEAPTGTGKSMAYGIPLALHALATGESVVIATANITLQEQLFKKDLPFIADLLDNRLETEKGTLPRLNFRLVKGMSNYLCLDKFAEVEEAGRGGAWVNEIGDWSSRTDTGDKSELDVEYPAQVWNSVSATADECTKGQCKFFEECFVFKSRGVGEARPDVVVTNYHMLYTDLLIKEATAGQASLLPQYNALVMDEAHEAVDIAMSFSGFELTEPRIKWLAKNLMKMKHKDADRIYRNMTKCAEAFFSSLHASKKDDILRKPLGYDGGLMIALEEACSFVEGHTIDKENATEAARRTAARLKVMSKAFMQAALQINEVAFGSDGKLPGGKVYFIEKTHKGMVKLCCKVVEVQGFLKQHIFSKKNVVGVSATLSTNGNFKFISKEMGLRPNEYSSMIAPNPFDPGRVLLVVPSTVPPPKQRDQHMEAVARTVEKILHDLGGRTMALFTSYRALSHVNKYLSHVVGHSVKLLVQGELPKLKIIEEFKRNPRSAILATASFWQGVDIPGQALSCLVIDKFPFMPPSDPVLRYIEDAISMDGGSAFFEYSVPKAVIALKQGVGRLIRTETDYGVVVLCDNRIDTTGYGQQFLKAFPTGHYKSEGGSLGDVRGFLESMGYKEAEEIDDDDIPF